jgi:hypothetical protein
MESYQTWFAEGPELSVLHMLGLFDRPADEKVLEALLKSPAIPELTERSALASHIIELASSVMSMAGQQPIAPSDGRLRSACSLVGEQASNSLELPLFYRGLRTAKTHGLRWRAYMGSLD